MLRQFQNEILFRWRALWPKLRVKSYSEKFFGNIPQELIPDAIASEMKEDALRSALFYAWMLEQIPLTIENANVRALDIGSANFFYVGALAQFLSKRAENFSLMGLEVDPYRMYSNFYRRKDVALYYCGLAQNFFGDRAQIAMEFQDWLQHSPPTSRYDLITCFFPFLFEDLHDGWGIPRGSFHPERAYRKTLASAKQIIFFHQGEDEREESLRLLKKIGVGEIIFRASFHENPFVARKFPVEVLVWKNS